MKIGLHFRLEPFFNLALMLWSSRASNQGVRYPSVVQTILPSMQGAARGEPPTGGPSILLVHDVSLVHRDDALGSGRFVSEGAVGTNSVVVSTPLLDQDLCLA